MTDIDSDQTLRTQAIDWIAQEASGGLNEQQRQECEQWRARSSRHWQAWKEAEQVWQLMAQMQPAADGGNDVSEASETSVPVSPGQDGQAAVTGTPRWRRLYTVAGLCAGLVLAVLLAPWQRAPTMAPEQQIVSSAVPKATLHTNRSVAVRQITLADGSRVYLNAATQISAQFSPSQRRIELLKGEALFEVEQDPNRPFIVRSGSTQAAAVGTAFTVRRRGPGASVVVTEGTVAVSLERSSRKGVAQGRSESHPERDPMMAARAIVQANQSVSSDGTDLSAVMSVNAANHVAWHRGVLMFRDTPLRDVIAEINRYSPYRIEADLAHRVDEPITGTFFIERLDEDMGSLVSGFGLLVVKQEPGLLQLALAHPSRP